MPHGGVESGIDYETDITQADNPVLPVYHRVHGRSKVSHVKPRPAALPQCLYIIIVLRTQNAEMSRVHRTAELPEAALQPPGHYSGSGSSGKNKIGSGKGGHGRRTNGEKAGMKAHKADGLDAWALDEWKM